MYCRTDNAKKNNCELFNSNYFGFVIEIKYSIFI